MFIHPVMNDLCCLCVGLFSTPVIIDGQFEDWSGSEAPDTWLVEGASNKDYVFLHLQHPGPPRVIQHLDETLQLAIDLDGRTSTGCTDGSFQGCELILEMSPSKKGKAGGGVTARSWKDGGKWVNGSPYDFGFVMAPTFASREHEIRLDKSSLPNNGKRMRVVLQSGDDNPVITDFKQRSSGKVTAKRQSIPTTDADDIRVASWNIEFGGLLKRADTVKALLESLAPDILLIQELEDDQDEEAVSNFLDSLTTNDDWTVSMSPAGSGLRSAVATRLKAEPVDTFNRVTRSDAPGRTIRVAGLLIDDGNGLPILAVSLHLKCCGGLNEREDLTRISEVLSIREAISEAVAEHQPSGLVIGGDFNLVASPVPLDILRIDGQSMLGQSHQGNLDLSTPYHLDGRDTYTWYNAGSPYTPGRLDFILTGGELEQSDAFILDTSDLSTNEKRSLPANATRVASDHLPVVVDIKTVRP
ncbi:MAG: endonuclease/exonuclease/phosphatase family protein [Phycisphaerales bacterium]|nr:endonuclease/exonuclease/phosphatase family protein [Phycisphaerales bacterium]